MTNFDPKKISSAEITKLTDEELGKVAGGESLDEDCDDPCENVIEAVGAMMDGDSICSEKGIF